MSERFIQNSEPARCLHDDRGSRDSVRAWVDVMESCHQILLAGLRASAGEDGDVQAAYREWYRLRMQDHDRMVRRLAESFHQRYGRNATHRSTTDA
jgi:hypothetical protein